MLCCVVDYRKEFLDWNIVFFDNLFVWLCESWSVCFGDEMIELIVEVLVKFV